MASRTSRPSAGEDLGVKLLKSVREMKAEQAARVTKVELNEVAQARQKSGLSQTQFAEALGISSAPFKSGSKGAALRPALPRHSFVLPSAILRWCERRWAERAVEQVVRRGHAAALRRQPCAGAYVSRRNAAACRSTPTLCLTDGGTWPR